MSQVSRSASKLKFQTADVPTQADFEDLHDSVPFLDDSVFTAHSGTSWDGSYKTRTLTGNLALTFSSTKKSGAMIITQDATGGRTLSINGTSVTINDGANEKTLITFIYDDVAAAYLFAVETNIVGVSGGGGIDVTPPGIFSITAIDATHIEVVFNESVTASTAGWSFEKNGSPLTLTSVTGAGTTWTFLVGTMLNTDTITYDYDSLPGDTVDGAANALASSSGAVTNSIGGGGVLFTDTNRLAFHRHSDIVASGGLVEQWTNGDGDSSWDFIGVPGEKPVDGGADGVQITTLAHKADLASEKTINGPLTIYALIKINAISGLFNSPTGGAGYRILIDPGAATYFNPESAGFQTGAGLSLATFKVVTITWDGSGLFKLYLDGVAQAASTGGSIGSSLKLQYLNGGSGSNFNGNLKGLAFFDVEHSAGTVSTEHSLFKAEAEA